MLPILLLMIMMQPGYPGPESRADYIMDVTLDPDSDTVTGSCSISFTSGVSFPVDTLWLHLYPNAYRDADTPFGRDLEAVGRYGFRSSGSRDRGWIDLADWRLNGESVEVMIDDCLGFIPLEDPLDPGDTVVLQGSFQVHVPRFWSRMGHAGDTFQVTQWYPKMCVLDPDGWHRGRYRWRGEFYSDFGNYTVDLTVPDSFLTAATGSVQSVRFSPDSTSRTETWHAENVHDFVWAASPQYTVREHTFKYPLEIGGDSVRVHLVLLDDDPEHWDEVPAVIDSTLLYYGQWYAPYPYEDLWVVEPVVLMAGGMEYPQFVFSGAEIPMTRALEMVTAHEIGHQWFYGLLGNNEVDEAWLDEGINTFSELRYMERRYGFSGNMTTTPSWFLDVSDQDMNLLTYLQTAGRGEEVPVLSRATDAGDGSYSSSFTYYSKPALFMRMIQMEVGRDTLDEIMSTYVHRFAYHHPHTDDFQAIVEEVTGRSWQQEFDFWLGGTESADLRVDDLRMVGDSTIASVRGDIPHPLRADLLFIRGGDSLLTSLELLPDSVSTATVPGNWEMAVVDPFLMFPDRAPWNNSIPVRSRIRPLIVPFPRPSHYTLWLLPFPSYAAGSWTFNVNAVSAPVTSYMGGPYTWTSSLSVPLGSRGYSAWSSNANIALCRSPRSGTYLNLGISRGYGIGRASAGIDYRISGRVPADLRYSASLGATLFSVQDTSVYGGANVQEGRGLEMKAGIGASDEAYRISWKGRATCMASPGWDAGSYARLDLQLDITTRFFGSELLRTRIYAGRVMGDAPAHVLLRPGGGLFAGGAIGAFLPPDGTLSPLEHYYVRKGPALPGYWNSALRGRTSLVLEQRIPLPFPLLPVEGYLASGWLADGQGDCTEGTFLSDAGIAVRLAMMEIVLPLWISNPPNGEDQWQLRWRLGLSPAGFPDLY